ADGSGKSANVNWIIFAYELRSPPGKALVGTSVQHQAQSYDKNRQTSVKEATQLAMIGANSVTTIPFSYVNKILYDCFDEKIMHPLFMTLSEATIHQLRRYLVFYGIFEHSR